MRLSLRRGAGGSSVDRIGRLGGLLLALLVLMAVLAPLLAQHDPRATDGPGFHAPTGSYLLGTDDVGHDLFAQLVYGTRVSLAIGVLSAVVALAVGLAVALAAGHLRGRVETVLMRLVDLTLSLPFFVLVIVLAAFLGRGVLTTVVIIGGLIWARPARVLRSHVVRVREFQHVLAAETMGASTPRIVGRHILPRVAPLAVSQFVRAANVAVLIESALAFLGLGDPGQVSWGTTLYFANARNAFLTDAWVWWILPPGLALTAAVVGFAFVGFAIEERADPRLVTPPGERERGTPRSPATPGEPPAPGIVLDVRGLVVEYAGRQGVTRAVDGVDFSIGPGRIVGLVGESGSGKSTIASALLRLVRPPGRVIAGEIWLAGRDLRRLRGAAVTAVRGREMALIPQTAMNALNPAYTILRQVAEAAALLPRSGEAATARATELLGLVGLPAARHRAYPHELSGGMRQRVVIAMALANEPSLVVADEPVTGLDVITQARIVALLSDIQSQLGFALLLISHDLPLVSRVADELLVMQAGRIVERGTAGEVTARPRHPHTRTLLEPLGADNGDESASVGAAGGLRAR